MQICSLSRNLMSWKLWNFYEIIWTLKKCHISSKFSKFPYSPQSYCPIQPKFAMQFCSLSRHLRLQTILIVLDFWNFHDIFRLGNKCISSKFKNKSIFTAKLLSDSPQDLRASLFILLAFYTVKGFENFDFNSILDLG